MLDPITADVLREAVGAAQTGDLQRARQLAENALLRGGDVVALNAFLGMLRARAGDAAGAIRHLKAAHGGRPGDVTIACNLIAALIESGDLAGALEVATSKLAFSDASLRVARYRGFVAQSLDRFADAAEAYDYVVARAPGDFESWNNLGNARSALGDFTGSVDALERAVALDPLASPTRLNLANALRAADRDEEAEQTLRAAAADFPDDARALNELYVLFKRQARQEEALPALEEAVRRDPKDPDLQVKLGIEYGLVNRIAEAERAFREAIALNPVISDAYLGLVIQYEHTNRENEFAPLIALAEANGVDPGTLGFLRAMENRRQGEFESALENLSHVPPATEPERTAHIRATVLDRLGRTDEAFAAFEETARLHQAHPTQPLRRGAEMRDEIRKEAELLTPDWIAGWRPAQAAADGFADPVFLVGFPRSGTTLLDTILMGHPGTTVLEEQPPLNLVDTAIGGFEKLAALDDAGIAKARAHYFEEVRKIEPYDGSTLLVDKSPLFLHKVPLIQRLFPNARFILALRHPCDVLLSCYMSNFRLNAAMANFLRLEDAAEFYDLTFRYWERSGQFFPVNVHTIVYEKLIENVEGQVRPLLEFLGLEWHEGALDHQRTAKSRGLITTASYSQVTEPIYKRAAGRWERYRTHLEPILPTLEPWVEKFGYSL